MTKEKEEVWRELPGYSNYMVSDRGNVKSLDRRGWKGRVLKQMINSKYKRVGLSKDGIERGFHVHQLVAMSFLGHTSGGYELVVDHIDGNKMNNNLINLQVITNRENCTKDKKGGSSQYIGVSWHKRRSKWIARISINRKSKFLGYFTNEIDASNAYQKKLKEILK